MTQCFSTEKEAGRTADFFIFASDTETLLEAIDASAAVNQLLLAGIERVALGANFDLDVLFGGTSLNDFAASTADRRLFVLRMDTFLHHIHLFLGFVKGHNTPYFFKAQLYYHNCL